ncbi:hypothetical protein G9F72_010245 [Clostridium estertheticum]|uniref:hypothetical protein n=1 Tax=Clostridium estertheticum TaxID=238834 RepID=UPI0013E908AC|nr:hypothetical protein [Clostridium estertheticum]MBZ9686704.1 hypothetical protein [Clostridium estertheticum]
MNNHENINLSIFLYRYMNQLINKNSKCKKEKTSNMENNFKEELKQHFRTLTLNDKNSMELDMYLDKNKI